MTLNLPKPIAAYFAADTASGEAVARCFTEAAVVKDEGHTYRGRAAIRTVEGGRLGQVPVHERAPRVRAEGRQIRRHLPAYRKLSRQPGQSFGSSSNSKATRSRRWKSSRSSRLVRKEA